MYHLCPGLSRPIFKNVGFLKTQKPEKWEFLFFLGFLIFQVKVLLHKSKSLNLFEFIGVAIVS